MILSSSVVFFPACASVQNAAAQDPQKCERDPKCNHKQDKSQDCITACADNYDCMSRCDQVNEPNKPL
ncbi:MAG TPA: hypothetical protein VGI70_07825 [Polyangiales bacterium]